jgi:uncharacterized protein (DUF983 family)
MDYNVKKSNDIPAALTITCIILAILIGLFGLFCVRETSKYDTTTKIIVVP